MENLKIYVARLKDGVQHKIDETLLSDFLDVTDEELNFPDKVKIQGETYLADDHLIIHLNIETTATLPCSICNAPVRIPIEVDDLYLTKELREIRTGILDFSPDVREAVLLHIPQFAECDGNKCPEREELKKFLK